MDKPQATKPSIHSRRKAYSWLGVVMLLLLSIPVTAPAPTVERSGEAADHPIMTAPGESGYLIAPRLLQPQKQTWTGFGALIVAIGVWYYGPTAVRLHHGDRASIAIGLVMLKLAPIKMTSTYVSLAGKTPSSLSRI